MAAVLRDEPDWNALPSATPAGLRGLLRRCLAKDPRKRLRDIGDALLDLDDLEKHGQPDTEPAPASAASPAQRWVHWVLLLISAIALTAAIMTRTPRSDVAERGPTRVDLVLPGLGSVTNRWGTPPIALSPDGRTIVYALSRPDAEPVLAVHLASHRFVLRLGLGASEALVIGRAA